MEFKTDYRGLIGVLDGDLLNQIDAKKPPMLFPVQLNKALKVKEFLNEILDNEKRLNKAIDESIEKSVPVPNTGAWHCCLRLFDLKKDELCDLQVLIGDLNKLIGHNQRLDKVEIGGKA